MSAASASVSPRTNVAAGRMSSSSWRRPYLARRPLTSAKNAWPSASVPYREKMASAADGRELATVVGVACLEDDRPALRAAGHVEPAADVEMCVLVGELAGVWVGQEHAAVLVGHDLVSAPGVEQRVRRLEEALGALVALVLGEEAPAAKVLSGERIPRRHDVPRGTAVGQVVQRRELPGDLVRFVEGRVDGAGQAEAIRHRGQRGEHREGVRAADHVEVVDLTALLAQAQTLGEEQEVELAAFGGLGEVHERAELDVTSRRGVAPDGGVVDAGEVCGEVNLLHWLAHWTSWRSDGGITVGGAGQAEGVPQGAGAVGVTEHSATLQLRHQPVGDPGEVMGQDGRTQAESRRARRVPLLDEVGELRRSAGEDLCVTGEFAPARSSSRCRRARAASTLSSRKTTRSANTRTGGSPRARRDEMASTTAVTSEASWGVMNPTSALAAMRAYAGSPWPSAATMG